MGSNERKVVAQISELIRQLEEQLIDPKTLDKITLQECAAVLKTRGYSSTEIANFLKVNERTIQRYIKVYRTKIKLELGENFQQELVAEIVNNMRLRCQRLWRLVHSGTLSASEEARAICAIHQIEMDKLSMMERLGYIQESQIREEVIRGYESAVDKREQEEVSRQPWIHDKRLTPEQITELKKFYISENRVYPHKSKELPKRMKILVEIATDENEFLRQRSIDVALKNGLRCSVNVINGLHKYEY